MRYKDDTADVVEVSQDEVKKALKALLIKRKDILATLYRAHEEINQEHFGGGLSLPLITIERMNNRTLANYTRTGANRIGVDNHIRFNENFVALNPIERVILTLTHESIHQLQDEVLYKDMPKKPRNWHNVDFKKKAEEIGLPCEGKRMSTGPCQMPSAKSYNRKFACSCVASNGYPLTIWSTRAVDATCNICGQEFIELRKATPSGVTIPVVASHVEKPKGKEDAVELMAKNVFKLEVFKRFKTREEMDEYLDKIMDGNASIMDRKIIDHGVYQKNHHMYGKGWRYWVAYNEAALTKWNAAKTKKPLKRTALKVKGGDSGAVVN